jgi:isoaspartyl peptidase/L-asparaginase-like protein (Ntn-hydrolase superfamily)
MYNPPNPSPREVFAMPEFAAIATWPFGMTAVQAAAKVLAAGGPALDAAIAGGQAVEDDPAVNSVGYGGLPNSVGVVQLDACVMDGKTLSCGAVAGLERIRHPAAVARRVMEKTPHVLLVGQGALHFARDQGFVEENLLTEQSLAEWKKRKSAGPAPADRPMGDKREGHDTVTVLCRDKKGGLGGCCTTSGLAHKLPGRVGDSPIIGAGLYVDDTAGAAGGTGVGEEAIRISAATLLVEHMRSGKSPQQAVEAVVAKVNEVAARRGVHPARLAFLALSPKGEYGACCTRGTGFQFAVALDGKFELLKAGEL